MSDMIDLEVEALRKMEEECPIRYVTSFERIGIQKGLKQGFEEGFEKGFEKGFKYGLEQGIEQGASRMLIRQLEWKFKVVPEEDRQKIEQADRVDLFEWAERLAYSDTLEEMLKT